MSNSTSAVVVNLETVQSVLSFDRGIKVAVARQNDPERQALAPTFNVYCRTENLTDTVRDMCHSFGWTTVRTGPQDLLIDPSPNYQHQSVNENYSSVWDD